MNQQGSLAAGLGLGSLAAVFKVLAKRRRVQNSSVPETGIQILWLAVPHSLSQFESPVAAEWLMSLNIQKVDECLLRDI